jgi:hypothetical protein
MIKMVLLHSPQLLYQFNHHGTSTASSIADTCTSKFAALRLQNSQQGGQYACTARTQRVANGDSTAVEVDLVLREAKQLHICKGYNTEGLVYFKDINILLRHTGVPESLGNSK